MRTRREINRDFKPTEKLILEVLMDIRDLLKDKGARTTRRKRSVKDTDGTGNLEG